MCYVMYSAIRLFRWTCLKYTFCNGIFVFETKCFFNLFCFIAFAPTILININIDFALQNRAIFIGILLLNKFYSWICLIPPFMQFRLALNEKTKNKTVNLEFVLLECWNNDRFSIINIFKSVPFTKRGKKKTQNKMKLEKLKRNKNCIFE